MLTRPDSLIDEHGGLMIPYPERCECYLPNPEQCDTVRYYRTGCCREWYWKNWDEHGTRWSKIGRFKLHRLKKKGAIPND